MQSMPPSSPGAPASAAAATTASVMRSATEADDAAAPSPTRTGRRGSNERIGPATTADATVPPWPTAKRAGGRRNWRISRKESFEADGKRRDVFRIGTGPAVIVISEIPGITPLVAQFGRRVAAAGCTAVLPVLFGDPGRPASAGYALQSIGPACVSREFSAFALKRTSPITVWLRKLAASEHERCGGPGVGVVGMCFTGGFALAMMVDDIVLAPVLSQPSLPFPLSKKFKADIGISDGDLAKVKERTATGTCLLGLRFTNDPFCFEERFETLRRELGDAFIAVEIDSAPGNPHGHPKKAHSVLTEHLDRRGGHAHAGRARPDAGVLPREAGCGVGPRASARTDLGGTRQAGSGRRPQDLLADALTRAHRAVHGAVRRRRRLGAGPVHPPDGLAQPAPVLRQHAGGEVAHGAAPGPFLLRPVLLEHFERRRGTRARGAVVSIPTNTSRRSASPSAARARARGPAAYPAMTPWLWLGWHVSRVTSMSSSVATVAPETPSWRQKGSS